MTKEEAITETDTAGKETDIAIIGIGCLFPGAHDKKAYWANIREGIDAISEIPSTHWSPQDYFDSDPKSPDHTYGRRGGFLSAVPFNPLEYNIPPNTLEAIDTSQLLGLVATAQALEDAGYGPGREYDRNRVSVILGVTGTLELVIPLGARLGHPIWRRALREAGVDEATAEDVVGRISEAYVPWQENSFPGLLGNVVAGRISKNFDLGGTNCVVDAACASSFSALHLAALELSSGKSDMVVTGGIDTFNDIFMYMCFSKTPALSPTGNAKPFDSSGDGTILGEGLGLVVIKRLQDAERDGDRIYAVIKGVGTSSDGKGEAIYAPSASGQKKALLDAYARSGIPPQSIGMVEAHGTGTKVGDAVEVSALREVFGEAAAPRCALGSVKSQIGHTKAAAGAAGLIKAAMALHTKVVPPTIKVSNPLPEVTSGRTPFYLASEKRPWVSRDDGPRRAAVSAFGFGGSNFHVVLEEYERKKQGAEWDGSIQIIAFSSSDPRELAEQVARIPDDPDWKQLQAVAAASRSLFDPSLPCRLTLVVERGKTNLKPLKANACSLLERDPDGTWQTPDGAYYSAASKGGLAVIFPGQGSQYPGMLRDLACRFPAKLAALEQADAGFDLPDGRRLSDLIYPLSAFTPAAAARQVEELRDTRYAQPAIGAVSLGAFRVLEEFGIAADAFAGHSYGELTALAASGRLGETDFHLLSRLRGELMAAGDGDKGSMLAVTASPSDIELVLSEEKLDLVQANKNAPSQTVLSGASGDIKRAVDVFGKRGIPCRQLEVSAAFHSPLVADAAVPFHDALAAVKLSGGAPVYANSTGALYPPDETACKDLLARQLARPVEFVSQIEAMYASGIRTFVEAGPGARLTGLVKAILGDRPHAAVPIDGSGGKKSGVSDLARTLAHLAALGYPLLLHRWEEDFVPAPEPRSKKPALTVPLCGANHVNPREKRPPRPAAQHVAPKTEATATAAVQPGSAMLAESLRVTRESISILQKMQEETARLHQRFLEGQELAGRTFHSLLEQQRLLLGAAPVPAIAAPERTIQPPTEKVDPTPLPASVQPPLQPSPLHEPSPSAASEGVTSALIAVVSEKTGYPAEMLDLDMGLETDLGIDSIKRVEILSTLQERLPGAPVIGPEQLGVLRTLGEIADFLGAGAPAAAVSGPAVTSSAPSADVAGVLLSVVSEKTGYPAEMLDLEMGLEADLGIDSIKRVEILSTLQERLPGAPAIGPEQLGTLRTLGEIAAYLGSGSPARGTSPAPVLSRDRGPAASVDTAAILLEVVSDKTGYPAEMLDLEMGLEADLGIDSIKRVEILSALQERLPGSPAIGPEQLGTLRTLGEIATFLSGEPAPSGTAPTAAEIRQEPAKGAKPSAEARCQISRSTIAPVIIADAPAAMELADGGEVWITDDGSPFVGELAAVFSGRGFDARVVDLQHPENLVLPPRLSGLIVPSPSGGTDDAFLEDALMLLKTASSALRLAAADGAAIFATISRIDGAFGCSSRPIADPLAGALAGMVKTAAREWGEVTCRAIDIDPSLDPRDQAGSVAEELFRQGPVETCLSAEGRFALSTVNLPDSQEGECPLAEGDAVIVTGGARGVTAAAAVALAGKCRPLLILLGRNPAPAPEPDWLQGLEEEPAIKRALMEHAEGKLHPREIEEKYQAVVAGREIRTTLSQVESAGGKAMYRSMDIRSPQDVLALLSDLRRDFGPIRGIVHGAGVLADRLIAEKTREQFRSVFSTKVEGLQNLLQGISHEELRFLVLFASTTGRFGRTGQVDYSMANEALNKMAQAYSRRNPGCRVVSINWGPWEGGMVSPALKKVFASEGVSLIDPVEGAEFMLREISSPDSPVEVVAIAGIPGKEIAPAIPAPQRNLSEAFTLNLTVADYPFLRSHVMDGKAVLPMAMVVEWLSHGAMHGNPGFRFHGFNDLRICKGVTFRQDTPCTLQILAGKAEKRETFHLVPVELQSRDTNGREILHARAEIVLASRLPEGIRALGDIPAVPYAGGSIYDGKKLFHGPDLQGILHVESCCEKGITAIVKGAPAPAAWIRQPFRSVWLTDPLALDSAFQMMILWSIERFGAASLPCFAGRYRQFFDSYPKDGVQIVVRTTSEQEHRATADMEFLDRSTGKLVARLENYECVIDPSLQRAFLRNELAEPACLELGAA